MPGKTKTNKTVKTDYYSKQLQRSRIAFGVVAVILILSMALALIKV